jgi:hypothetical protein
MNPGSGHVQVARDGSHRNPGWSAGGKLAQGCRLDIADRLRLAAVAAAQGRLWWGDTGHRITLAGNLSAVKFSTACHRSLLPQG